ncbi:N-acetylmuramoyl-L-alanine amidase [Alteribacillus sp. YIM 98480]|uniref:N-acetylmuramoyl-L-alanine amidase n=1 Tax=Alteribacillus sp. YIM 98480 TaxID=2606599 RepID=UPI0018EEED12|nr:N-acetylmuramoyl-L-alanine amidase [Alteribacillus sp. YIM 98480]
MMKLYLDPGHGGSDTGASGNGLLEKAVNLDIALRIRNILLNEYQNVEVRMSRRTDTTVSLTQRTNDANQWNADYFLSIHCNAYNGQARGYEDYIHNSLSDSSQTARLREIMHKHITSVNRLSTRGKKKANFHVLRETRMPALLTENGFIDNSSDAAIMRESSWRQAVARGHVNGLEEAFNLQQKQDYGTLYKVIAGSFENREHADNRAALLNDNGIEAFVVLTTISDKIWYRVQAGSFKYRDNAETRVERIRQLGIEDAFITIDQDQTNEDNQDVDEENYSILGDTILSPQLLNQFAKSIHSGAPELGYYYLKYGEYYGIRGDVAFAQALHETDFFRFTGVVKPEQNNFCGLGATDRDNPGASFDTPEEGVLAHIQHLYAYSSSSALPDKYPLVDPRFQLVERGSATTWVGLNGKWAVPGDRYGQMILNLYERNVKASQKTLEDLLEEIKA